MDWRIKGLIQGVLARTPGGMAVNDLLQRTLGGRRRLDEHVSSKIHDDWLVHMHYLRSLGFKVAGATVVEVGTGWLPVLPLCFVLAGVRRVHTFDLRRHLGRGAVQQALRLIEPHVDAIANAAGLPVVAVRDHRARILAAGDDAALLAAAGVEYHAPADATRTGLADGSVDLVISNSVLEHVPVPTLDALLGESRRMLRAGGISLHGVNCGDHYAYADPSITPIHYLRYSDQQWKRWNNDLLFQNRLRASDFLAAAERVGLRVVLDSHRPRVELLECLSRLPIDPAFGHYSPDDLCCTSIDFAATPEDAGAPPAGPA